MPDAFTGTLAGYQFDGVRWMLEQLGNRGGCVLADEPGLGKTAQALAVVSTLVARGATRVLVVAPAHVLKVWAAEAAKFVEVDGARGAFRIVVAADPSSERVAGKSLVTAEKLFAKLADSPAAPLVVAMSYGQVQLHGQGFAVSGAMLDALVLDKAHRVKNASSQTAIAVAQLPSRRHLLLSATPVTNELEELRAVNEGARAATAGPTAAPAAPGPARGAGPTAAP